MKSSTAYFLAFMCRGYYSIILLGIISCNHANKTVSKEAIAEINLKRGTIISCGPDDKQFGLVEFETSCSENVKKDFNTAIELLHSFEYDEAEKKFAAIIDEDPSCAMAFWGVAMSNFHPLWNPPTEAELIKGEKSIKLAASIAGKSDKESAYINALFQFYKDWNKTDHHTRTIRYETAMQELHNTYPGDKEAAIFYALALDAAANPSDKSYTKQKQAGDILNTLYKEEPNHPGIIHYIIHTYDYPVLAEKALPAARKYAAVAPSSAHALHMPSHIFTRLGLWNECISSNLQSISSAKCYAEAAGIKGHWDEELHGMDYLVYAYLQKAQNNKANEQLEYLKTFTNVSPLNFKVAYAFASIPVRVAIENHDWNQASLLQLYPANFAWSKFPWQEAIIHYGRLLGMAHLGKIKDAESALTQLNQLHLDLKQQKDEYKATQVAIQMTSGAAWIQFAKRNTGEALKLMTQAAAMEDSTEKHPVTPGEVLPARELLADMFLQLGKYQDALQSYEAVLQKCPNRFNSIYGAAEASVKMGDAQKAKLYFLQLTAMVAPDAERPEIIAARSFLRTL